MKSDVDVLEKRKNENYKKNPEKFEEDVQELFANYGGKKLLMAQIIDESDIMFKNVLEKEIQFSMITISEGIESLEYNYHEENTNSIQFKTNGEFKEMLIVDERIYGMIKIKLSNGSFIITNEIIK